MDLYAGSSIFSQVKVAGLKCEHSSDSLYLVVVNLIYMLLVVGVYVLATTKVISGVVLTCGSVHSW